MTSETPAAAPAWGAPSDASPDPKRWIALIILSSALFIIVLDNTILNVAVPTIIRDFHTQVSSLQWVISGYSLVFAALLISFGRLGDIFGRRKLFFTADRVDLDVGRATLSGRGAPRRHRRGDDAARHLVDPVGDVPRS
jgi:hypothetical protein